MTSGELAGFQEHLEAWATWAKTLEDNAAAGGCEAFTAKEQALRAKIIRICIADLRTTVDLIHAFPPVIVGGA